MMAFMCCGMCCVGVYNWRGESIPGRTCASAWSAPTPCVLLRCRLSMLCNGVKFVRSCITNHMVAVGGTANAVRMPLITCCMAGGAVWGARGYGSGLVRSSRLAARRQAMTDDVIPLDSRAPAGQIMCWRTAARAPPPCCRARSYQLLLGIRHGQTQGDQGSPRSTCVYSTSALRCVRQCLGVQYLLGRRVRQAGTGSATAARRLTVLAIRSLPVSANGHGVCWEETTPRDAIMEGGPWRSHCSRKRTTPYASSTLRDTDVDIPVGNQEINVVSRRADLWAVAHSWGYLNAEGQGSLPLAMWSGIPSPALPLLLCVAYLLLHIP